MSETNKSNSNKKGSSKTKELKTALARIDQLTEAIKRERADLINARQRFVKEKTDSVNQAQRLLLLDLLPLIDNLQRAFANSPKEINEHQWVKGVLGIESQLQQYLSQLNLQPIATVGQIFDPTTMEAMATVEDSKQPSGLVTEELLPGYLYQDQVLRVAQVRVVS